PAGSRGGGPALGAGSAGPWWDEPAPLYEVEELKAQPGEQVQAGQVLCYLADHRHLYVEGRGFKEDAVLVERSAANGWPVAAAFAGDRPSDWPGPGRQQELTIRHVANALDPARQPFPFYVPLANPYRDDVPAG